MAIGMNTSLRNARAQKIVDALDAGNGGNGLGQFNFYDGTRPATGGLVTGLLAELVLQNPSASVTNGVITFNSITDDVSANANGTIKWGRLTDSDGTFVMDVSCGITGSGADVIFNTTTAKVGGAVQIISATITEGGA